MKTVVGFDEAGYGPTLGPLVVGCAAFRLESGSTDLYRRLQAVVRPGAVRGDTQLGITDSKRLYGGRRSLGALELPVLAFRPDSPVPGPLETILPEDFPRGTPPWYAPSPQAPLLPVAVRDEAILGWRERLRPLLAQEGVAEVHCRVEPVHEPRFNRLVEDTGNKAQALIAVLLGLLRSVTDRYPEDDLELRVDRLGGRRFYQGLLGAAWPLRPVTVLRQDARCSAYRIRDGSRTIHVSFETGSDATHLPVALASMNAKYAREVLLSRLNAYFERRRPGLRPTAGYPQDARRFLEELGGVLEEEERRQLVRCC